MIGRVMMLEIHGRRRREKVRRRRIFADVLPRIEDSRRLWKQSGPGTFRYPGRFFGREFDSFQDFAEELPDDRRRSSSSFSM